MRKKYRGVGVIVSALSVAVVLLSPAAASAATRSAAAGSTAASGGAAIAQHVLNSANPAAAYNALSDSAKRAFGLAERPVSAVVNIQDIRQTDVDPCWSAYVSYDWKAAAGNTVYTTWQGLNWCSNGSSITSYSVFTRGGETSTPGWSYNGNGGQGSWNVGWEVRQYTQEKFTFGLGTYFGYTTSPCTRFGVVRPGCTRVGRVAT